MNRNQRDTKTIGQPALKPLSDQEQCAVAGGGNSGGKGGKGSGGSSGNLSGRSGGSGRSSGGQR